MWTYRSVVELLGTSVTKKYLRRLFLTIFGLYLLLVVPMRVLMGFAGFLFTFMLVLSLGYLLLDDFARSEGTKRGHMIFVSMWWLWVLLGIGLLVVMFMYRFL